MKLLPLLTLDTSLKGFHRSPVVTTPTLLTDALQVDPGKVRKVPPPAIKRQGVTLAVVLSMAYQLITPCHSPLYLFSPFLGAYLAVFKSHKAKLCLFRSDCHRNSEVVGSLNWDPSTCSLLSINSGAAAALSLLL